MSDAIRELHDYLAKSPSVVYPEDVLAYLPAIEAENAKLRELVQDYYIYEHKGCYSCHFCDECHSVGCESREPFCIAPIRLVERTRELGFEVDG